jgi:ABC-2 family transporter protein
VTWLLWRQHRMQVWIGAALMTAFAIAVLLTGLHMSDVYDDAMRTCRANGTCSLVGNLFSGYGAIVDTVHLTLIVPIAFAVLGATTIAREAEQGTNVLAWTQSITRRRWVLSKVGTELAVAVLASAAISALVTWWSNTPNALYGNRFQGAQFDTQNVTPVAYAVFALALGLAVGSIVRRTLPALALTIGVYIAVRISVAVFLRPHYASPVTKTVSLGSDPVPSGSWTLRQGILDASGHDTGAAIRLPANCRATTTRGGADRCLGKMGFKTVAEYHPAGSYWRFQLIEAALFLTLAVVLVTIAIRATLHRDA